MPGNDYVEKLLTQILGKLDRVLEAVKPSSPMKFYENHRSEEPYMVIDDEEQVKYSRPDLMVDTTELETPSTPPSGLCMSDDGTDLYSCDIDTATIYQHDGEPIRFFSCDCDGCKKPNGQGCLKLTPNDVVYKHVGPRINTIPPPPAWVEGYNKCAIDCGKQKNELSKVCPCVEFKPTITDVVRR